MKSLCVVLLFIALTVALPHPDTEKYTTKYDNIDIDPILKNGRLLLNYFNCIMDKPGAKCTPEGKELKKHVKDAVQNDCVACSEKQREMAEKVLRHLYKHEKPKFNELSAKFDPEGKAMDRYKDKLQA